MTTRATTTNTPLFSDSLSITGTSGAGYLRLDPQSISPGASSGKSTLHANSAGELVIATDTREATLSTSSLTAGRTFTLPDASGSIVLNDNEAMLEKKTIIGGGLTGNTVDANFLAGFEVIGVAADGDVLAFDTGAGKISALTISATAPLNYSAGVFDVSVGSTAGTVAAGNDGRLSATRHVHVKASSPGAGEYTSISTALVYVASQSPSATNQWVVEVHPGVYVEPAMTIPGYVFVSSRGGAKIVPAASNITLFTCTGKGSLENFTLEGLSGVSDVALSVESSSLGFRISKCSISGFALGIRQTGVSAVCQLEIADCSFAPSTPRCIDQDARAVTGSFVCTADVRDCKFIVASNNISAITSRGPAAEMNIFGGQIIGPPNGDGVLASDGTDVNIHGMIINGTNMGLHVDALGDPVSLQAVAISIISTGTWDLQVEHSATVGAIVGQIDYLKTSQVAGSSVLLDAVDATNEGVIATGKLFLGPAVAGDTISEYSVGLNQHMALGVISGGVVTRGGSPLDVDVSAGYGYVASPLDATYSKYLSWTATTLSIPAGTTRYIQVDPTGTVVADTSDGGITYACLARVVATTEIEIISAEPVRNSHPWSDYSEFAENILGVLYQSGSLVTTNVSQEFSVSSGTYYYANQKRNPSGKAFADTFKEYYHNAGMWESANATTYDVSQYDDVSTGKTALPATKYTKHFIFVNSDGANERYFLVYGQEIYDTAIAAEEAVLDLLPPEFYGDVAMIAGIVVLSGTAAAIQVIDHRPFLTRAGNRPLAVLDHGDLTGLLDDDHPQYLPTNGSRPMTGNLPMGGNNITGLGLVDGVQVSAHASRHLPSGLDALATAAPLTDLSSTSTNLTGTANSFARSDHTHAIDISGFSLNSLAGTLGVASGGTGATSFTSGNVLVGAGVGPVTAAKAAPTGAFVGTSDAQTLSNKTATIAAGNIIEASSINGITTASGPLTTGQVLTATSATTAGWSLVADSSITGAISAAHGGTGVSSPTTGFVAVSGNPFTFTKASPSGNFVGTTDTQTLTNKTLTVAGGNTLEATSVQTVIVSGTAPTTGQVLTATSGTSAAWSNISAGSFTGTLAVANGGTGSSTLTAGNFVVGNGTGAVDTTKVAPAGVVVGTTDTQTLTNKTLLSATNTIESTSVRGVAVSATAPTANQALIATSGTAAAWTSITSSVISGTIDVPHGGTGASTLTAGSFLVGAGTSMVDTSKVAPTGDVVGTTDTQTLTNKTLTYTTNTINPSILRDVNIGATAPTANQVLVASSSTAAAWGSLPVGSLSGTLPVSSGGTGVNTLTAGSFLVGAGTSPVDTSKVAPSGAVVGTTDTQTLTNKTLTATTNSIQANSLYSVLVSNTPPSTGQFLVATSSTGASWQTKNITDFSGVLTVSNGGTGSSLLAAGYLLMGAGTSAVDTISKIAPAGAVVGTTDAQTLSNKTATIAGGNSLEADKISGVSISGTAPTAGQALVATSSTAAAWGSVAFSNITGTVPVTQGGTSLTSLTSGRFLVGAGTSAVDLTKTVPTGAVVGTTDSQTLSNKSILVSGNNTIEATSINTVVVSGTAPTAGQALLASTPTSSAWTTLSFSNISGTLGVAAGGTGTTSLTSGNVLVGAGTGAVDTSKVAPVGAFVGTSDAQTLTNKTLTIAGSNNVEAITLRGVTPTATAPTAGQVLVATSGTAAAWGSLPVGSLSGVLPVSSGGTGVNNLTTGNFLVGAGTGAVVTNKVVPTGVVVGDSDAQTLTNKTLTVAGGNTVEATSIQTVVISGTAPTANQVLVASTGTAAAWGSVPAGSISGTLSVANGGTGVSTLTSGNVLVGAGTGAVTTTKAAPTGAFVGTTDTQTLTNKTLNIAGGNVLEATSVQGVLINATLPSTGQALIATSSTTASWQAIAGTGTVSGPVSSTDNALVRWNGTSGILIKDSTATLSDTGTLSTTTLTLPYTTNSTTGLITKAGTAYLHDYTTGVNTKNLFLGNAAGNFTLTGASANTCLGNQTGTALTTGVSNILIGNQTGSAITTGSNNLILCNGAQGLVTGNDNLLIFGPALASNESGSIRIGTAQTACYLAGIYSSTPTEDRFVFVNSQGRLSGRTTIATTSLTGTLAVANGGTGATTLTSGNFLIGAGTSAVTTTKVAPTGTVVGTTDTQSLSNKTLTVIGGNTVEATSIQTVVVSGTAPTANQILVAGSATTAAWGNLPAASITGVISVSNGGTGQSTLTSGNFVVGNGTGAVLTSKAVPAGIVLGDTDTQTLTNKTLLSATNTIEATSVRTVAVSATAPTAGQVLQATSGTAASWVQPTAGVASTTVDAIVRWGDTGGKTLNNSVATLNSAGTLTTTNFSFANTTGASSGVIFQNSNRVFHNYSTGAANLFLGINSGNFTSVGAVANTCVGDGTGQNLTSGSSNIIFGNGAGTNLTSGSSNILVQVGASTLATGSGNIHIGSTLTPSSSESNTIRIGGTSHTAAFLSGVYSVNPTEDRFVFVNSSNQLSARTTIATSSLTGTLPVANGGTGASTLTSGNFLIGAGTSAVDTTKVAPAGVVVGTTDTQTLTNKTLTVAGGNTLEATSLRTVGISATAPTANQVLFATSGTAAQWQTVFPASSTDNALVRWNGTTGTLIKNSTATLTDAGTLGVTTLDLPFTTSSTAGLITKASSRYLHDYTGGSGNNLFLGLNSGNFTNTNVNNTCIGTNTGQSLTSGTGNIFVGTTTGDAVTSGNNNVFVSNFASAVTTGSNNLYLASSGSGGNESNAIRIGNGSHSAVYLSGVSGTPTANTILYYNNATGQIISSAAPSLPLAEVSYGDGTASVSASLSGTAWLAINNTNFAGTYTLTTNNSSFSSALFDNGGTAGQIRWLGAATNINIFWSVSFSADTIQLGLANYRFSVFRNGAPLSTTIITCNPAVANSGQSFGFSRIVATGTNDVYTVGVQNTNSNGGITLLALTLQITTPQPIYV